MLLMLRNSRVVCILKSPTGSVIVSVSTHGPLPAAPPAAGCSEPEESGWTRGRPSFPLNGRQCPSCRGRNPETRILQAFREKPHYHVTTRPAHLTGRWSAVKGSVEPESIGISPKLRPESSTGPCLPTTGETTGRSLCLAPRSV